MTYSLSEEQRKQFATNFLLDQIVTTGKKFSILLEGNDSHLDDLFTYMMSKDYLDIENDRYYRATKQGEQALLQFKRRYQEFLKCFDVYCAVDLEEGEFAFEKWWDYEDDDLWDDYLDDERWEDLRVPVAAYKGLDPLEIVFMGFLNEGRIDTSNEGWQFDLVLGSIWDELVEICNSALDVDDLAYEDEDGTVSGEDVLADIIRQGGELILELWEDEPPPIPPKVGGHAGRKLTVERISRDTYSQYAHDPRYISPIWRR